ncbi:MAG: OmpH family outer membrane protein [Gammaproteobacteria bacterium]|jgi:Skp family chaperone for outer membrane proteins|nr:OmpH family outer membrane protein [Gammaproteobacteria bacterium]MDP7270787.1 OmpH family outer membrane protein [Gammaproteobacteria bacterium]HJP05035.1 OmpH family outer membrane protein [Gammaproteobacteria bacterium]
MKTFRNPILLVSALLLAACDPAALQGGPDVAVLDLAAVAKATGQEDEIRIQAEEARNELTKQLQQLAASLEEQLKAERDKIGINPSETDAQRLQGLSIQAQQQINAAQAQAQAQASLLEQQLVNDYRDKVEPLAKDIASELGVSIVVTADANVVWFDPAVDITDEVIAAWRAAPAEEDVPEVIPEVAPEAAPEAEQVEEPSAVIPDEQAAGEENSAAEEVAEETG